MGTKKLTVAQRERETNIITRNDKKQSLKIIKIFETYPDGQPRSDVGKDTIISNDSQPPNRLLPINPPDISPGH